MADRKRTGEDYEVEVNRGIPHAPLSMQGLPLMPGVGGMNFAVQQMMANSGQYAQPGTQMSNGFDGSGSLQHGFGGDSTQDYSSAAEESSRGGGYKCSKCGLPKKGHICAYQPSLKRRDEDEPKVKCETSTQVEIDPNMTVRELDLHLQGTAESYQPMLQQPTPNAYEIPSLSSSSSSSSSTTSLAPTASTMDPAYMQQLIQLQQHQQLQLAVAGQMQQQQAQALKQAAASSNVSSS